MIKYQRTKTLITKPNNNSSDAISPNFIYGCYGNCMESYCYVARYNKNNVYVNTNLDEIFDSIIKWRVKQAPIKIPNQQSDTQYVIDIGCNVDIALHQKHLTKAYHIFAKGKGWNGEYKTGLNFILRLFDKTSDLQLTFATKYPSMLKLDVNHLKRKPRVRVSLMPQKYSDILEPNMQSIESRIKDIDRLQKLGWEVHINFSPVICYYDWIEEYTKLFTKVNELVENKKNVKCEVIFLTNHNNNMKNANEEQLELLKFASETKNKSGVMRYPLEWKKDFVQKFKELHQEIIPWCEIRYIF